MKVSLPGRPPDFVGFGVHRSGSTWLNSQLRRHPELWTPPPILKEVHYFDELHLPQHRNWHSTRMPALLDLLKNTAEAAESEADLRRMRRFTELATSDRDDDWYRAIFGICNDPARLVGEITPAYSLLGVDALEHLKRLNADIRVFIVLRDPAERVWSHLKLEAKAKITADPSVLEDAAGFAARADSMGVVSRTEYRRMLESLESVFSSDQIHVSFYDRVAEEPVEMLADIGAHLGVDPDGFEIENMTRRLHASPAAAVPDWLRSWSSEKFSDDIDWLADRYGGYPKRWLESDV